MGFRVRLLGLCFFIFKICIIFFEVLFIYNIQRCLQFRIRWAGDDKCLKHV